MDELKQVPNDRVDYGRKIEENELSSKQDNTKNKKILFYSVMSTSFLLLIVAIASSVCTLLSHSVTTQEVAVLTIMVTAPIIMILSLMRYVFDGKKEDAPQPTLILNIGKEFAGVLQNIFKK